MKALIIDALASEKGEKKSTRDAIGAGIRSIAGVLESRCVEYSVLEAESALKEGLPQSYDLLLVSGMTQDIPALRRVISKWNSGPVIVGGPVASDPEKALRRIGCDLVVVGEGEETLIELLQAGLRDGFMPKREVLREIRGIAFREGANYEINNLRRYMPREIFDKFKPSTSAISYYPLFHSARVYVEVLRGCSNYNRAAMGHNCESCGVCRSGKLEERYDCPLGIPPGCGYCSVPSLYGPPKSRSTSKISDEIAALLKEGVTRVVLSAPCFLDYGRDLLVEPKPLTDPRNPEPNYGEVEKLLSALANLPNMADGTASFMIENIKASLVTKKAAQILGRYLDGTPVSIGFETGSAEHSELLGRPSTPRETLIAIKRLKQAGLKPYVYFIHGLPGQSKVTVDETVEAIAKSVKEGAERVILYRFQSLPMSTFSGNSSAPPSIRDPLSRRIHEAAAKANLKTKKDMLQGIIRVVVAERYDRDRRLLVAYPLRHGPVVLVESGEPLEGRVLDVEITDIASERMVIGHPVARF